MGPGMAKRKKCRKFIPDADRDFALMARIFAFHVDADPARYMLSADASSIISRATHAFRDALADATRPATRTKITIMRKDAARAEAERIIRRYANLIRVNEDISHLDKMLLQIQERPKRLKRRKCPRKPPLLRFLRGEDSEHGSSPAVHILEFRDKLAAGSRAKPAGAARLELFVDLVPPGQPVPKYPGQYSGVPWYLKSFTKNPIEIEPPAPPEVMNRNSPGLPMLVVYWGRWADAKGEVGRFSETAIARVEGGGRNWDFALAETSGRRALEGECAPVGRKIIQERPLLDAA